MAEKVRVTFAVKSMVIESMKLYRFFCDRSDPAKHDDWEDWNNAREHWGNALFCVCVLCGLDGAKVAKIARNGDIEDVEQMGVSQFVDQFEDVAA